MKTPVLVSAILGFGIAAAGALDDARVVKFRVLCYEHAWNTTKALVTGATGNPQAVDFYTGGFGPQISGKFTGGKVRFFTAEPGIGGKPVIKVVAAGDLVASAMQMLLLVPAPTGTGLVYQVLAFDDLESSLPMGSTRVINLAAYPVRVSLAGAVMPPIKPGGVQVYPQVSKADDWNMFTARVDFEVEANKWIPAATQSWKSSNRKRDWVITYVNPATREPTIRIYQDIPPWREAQLPVSGGKAR